METLRSDSTTPYVKLVQSLLARFGNNPGPVDGFFGQQTQGAVIAFQRNSGLTPDGVVGPATWNAFERFSRGYDIYYIRPGDTLYNIAVKYYTKLNAVLTANSGITPPPETFRQVRE